MIQYFEKRRAQTYTKELVGIINSVDILRKVRFRKHGFTFRINSIKKFKVNVIVSMNQVYAVEIYYRGDYDYWQFEPSLSPPSAEDFLIKLFDDITLFAHEYIHEYDGIQYEMQLALTAIIRRHDNTR